MFIGAIKYKGLDIACAYKKGVIVWRPTQYKLVSFDNTLITYVPIFSISMTEVRILPKLTHKITSPNTLDISNVKSHPIYSELLLKTINPFILNAQDSWVRQLPWRIAALQKTPLQVSLPLYTNLFWINQIIAQNILVASPGRKLFPASNFSILNGSNLIQRTVQRLYPNQKIDSKIYNLLQIKKVLNAALLSQIKIIDILSLARRRSKNGQMHSVNNFCLNQYLHSSSVVQSLIKKEINLNKDVWFRINLAKSFDSNKKIEIAFFTDLGIKYSKISQITKNIILFDNIKAFVLPLKIGQSLQKLTLRDLIDLRFGREITSNVKKKIRLNNFGLLLNSLTNSTSIVKQVKLIDKNNLYYGKVKKQVINETIYLNSNFALFVQNAIKNTFRPKIKTICFDLLRNGIYLSGFVLHQIMAITKENLQLIPPNLLDVNEKFSLNYKVLLQQISPLGLAARHEMFFISKPFLQLDTGIYYFADNKNITTSFFKIYESASLDFLRKFMLINHHITLNYLLQLNLSNSIHIYNKGFQYLFYDLQFETVWSKIGRYSNLVNYSGYVSFNLGKKKIYSDFSNDATLKNSIYIDLSSLSYITSDDTNFKSDIFMRSFATLSMDSWIYPKRQETNLYIQQVNSYSPATGEIT